MPVHVAHGRPGRPEIAGGYDPMFALKDRTLDLDPWDVRRAEDGWRGDARRRECPQVYQLVVVVKELEKPPARVAQPRAPLVENNEELVQLQDVRSGALGIRLHEDSG